MPKKSKINIFKNMSKDELNTELSKYVTPFRIYQRLIAMKLISEGFTLKHTAETINVTYQTVNRWAKTCESEGIKGLIPHFGGGKPSYLSDEEKVKLDKLIQKTPNMTLKDVHALILKEFNVNYSMKQIGVIVKKLNYNYSKAYPKFSKSPENSEEILKKT